MKIHLFSHPPPPPPLIRRRIKPKAPWKHVATAELGLRYGAIYMVLLPLYDSNSLFCREHIELLACIPDEKRCPVIKQTIAGGSWEAITALWLDPASRFPALLVETAANKYIRVRTARVTRLRCTARAGAQHSETDSDASPAPPAGPQPGRPSEAAVAAMELPRPPRSRNMTRFCTAQRHLCKRVADVVCGLELDPPLLEEPDLPADVSQEERAGKKQKVKGKARKKSKKKKATKKKATKKKAARKKVPKKKKLAKKKGVCSDDESDSDGDYRAPRAGGRQQQRRRTSERVAAKSLKKKKKPAAKAKSKKKVRVIRLSLRPPSATMAAPRSKRSGGKTKRQKDARAKKAGWIPGSGAKLYALEPFVSLDAALHPPPFPPVARCLTPPPPPQPWRMQRT